MRSALLDRWASILVDYSVGLRAGQICRLVADPVGMDLLEAIYEAVIRKGAFPHVRLMPKDWERILIEHGTEEQLSWHSPFLQFESETIDASISLWRESNTRYLAGAAPARVAMMQRGRKQIFQTFMDRAATGALKWVGTQTPTQSAAQDADMSLREYEAFLVAAGQLELDDPVAYWKAFGTRQQALVERLDHAKELHFWTPEGTDLTVDVAGMRWVNCCGLRNFPDGEVFTGPNLDGPYGGVKGTVRFSFPGVHCGREVEGVVFRFEHGRVVEAHADKGLEFLIAALDMDQGARSVGEIAIGTNFGIQTFSKNTLFDEKIGGTFHLAVGAGYPQTGNKNVSSLHWDLVCDLRKGGTIKVDGELLMKDGRFLSPFQNLNPA